MKVTLIERLIHSMTPKDFADLTRKLATIRKHAEWKAKSKKSHTKR